MVSSFSHQRQNINLFLIIFLLINYLMMSKADAETEKKRDLLNSNKTSDTIPEKILINNSAKYYQENLNNIKITQNLALEPIRVFPNTNEINVPEPLNPLKKPDSDYDKPDIPIQQNITPILLKKDLELLILNALNNSALKYPWIIDPRDNFSFYSSTFNPLEDTKYINFSIKFSSEDPIFDRFSFANFPKQDQLYWILSGNRVVVETKGWQSGVVYQGESRDNVTRQTIRLTQKLWGMQAVFSLPQGVQELAEEIGINQFTVESIAAEVTNPVGVPAAPIIINTNSSNTSTAFLVPNAISFTTEKDPLILQSFPTSDLQPLLGEVRLNRGSVISQETLKKAGFLWGNPLTGQSTQFQPLITSNPGIKVGNREKFSNLDLFDILLNPSITRNQRSLSYLNSLYWVSLSGQQNNLGIINTNQKYDWHKFYFSLPHNRTLLKYDFLEPKATYTNISSNPGISLSLSFSEKKIDELQTANATLGMLIGGIFELINFPHLEQSLQEARERFSRQENFATLDSKTTPEQRRKINQVLNRTLFLSNITSGLEQVSGKLTFPSIITPNSSSMLQMRTGNHQRAVQFIDGKRTWTEGKTFISKAEVSNNSFGRLTSVAVPVPSQKTPNRSSAAQVTLTAPNGQQYVQNWSSADNKYFPINIRSFDIAFDRIELSQDGQLNTYLQAFDGYLSLPTIEVLWAGSSQKWNYSIGSGVWFNLNADSAFNIANNFGVLEPTLGIYTKGTLNYINTHIEVDTKGQPQAITNHIPSLQFYWNSAANSQNPAYLNLSYFFSHQNRNLNYSLSTAFILVDDNKYSLTPLAFLQGKLVLNTGLEFRTSLEIRDDFFYTLEGIKKINYNWYFGAYIQNFRNIDRGIKNRVYDFSYGLVIQRNTPGNNAFWESRIGMSGDIFEAKFQGGLRF
uniref:Uncharacterized protein n=2 Tax=Desmonostoc muscorum TaxID=1179 RepID=A0A8J7A6B9_DESMC